MQSKGITKVGSGSMVQGRDQTGPGAGEVKLCMRALSVCEANGMDVHPVRYMRYTRCDPCATQCAMLNDMQRNAIRHDVSVMGCRRKGVT